MLKASCQCGSLTVSSREGADFSVVCNCRACQGRTGSVFGVGAYLRRSGVTIEGASTTFERTAESGRRVVQHFCPKCGTTLFWELEMRPDHLGVAYSCITPTPPLPARTIWMQEAHPWVRFPEDWPSYPTGSPE